MLTFAKAEFLVLILCVSYVKGLENGEAISKLT